MATIEDWNDIGKLELEILKHRIAQSNNPVKFFYYEPSYFTKKPKEFKFNIRCNEFHSVGTGRLSSNKGETLLGLVFSYNKKPNSEKLLKIKREVNRLKDKGVIYKPSIINNQLTVKRDNNIIEIVNSVAEVVKGGRYGLTRPRS